MSDGYIWAVTVGLGVTTYLIRFSFLGLIGDRQLPPRVEQALGFVPVTVLPALVAPALLTGANGGLTLDAASLLPAAAVLAAGAATRRMLWALAAGLAVYGLLAVIGV